MRRRNESRWRLEEEGIGWLRGYYTADSKEVDACRTAQALGPVAPPKEMPNPHAVDLRSTGWPPRKPQKPRL